jgi:SpoVK/Ycf46/Vps4 family AAA+-type ATPase
MAGVGEHVKAMVRSHASGDDAAFYSVALQVAAREARSGHHVVADDIKKAVDASRKANRRANLTRLPQQRTDVDDVVEETNPRIGLRELVVRPELLEQIQHVIAEQRQRRVLLQHGFAPAHRLLLEGPPGTGKTMTASVLAAELQIPMFTIRLDGLMSKFMGETASKLRSVFEMVAERRGVYLFDEFDALGADRAGNDVGEARRILNSFLVFLESSSPDSIVIAATNHRTILDRALFRRFDTVLKYDLPDARQTVAILRTRLGSLARGLSLAKLGTLAEGLSHADLVRAAESAAKVALMRGGDAVSRAELEAALTKRRRASIG